MPHQHSSTLTLTENLIEVKICTLEHSIQKGGRMANQKTNRLICNVNIYYKNITIHVLKMTVLYQQ